MTEREEASALLSDVESIETRVREALTYARVSDYLFLWGTIWLIGFGANYFIRPFADTMWFFVQAFGAVATLAIVALHIRRGSARSFFFVGRAGLMVIAIIGFGTLWVHLTGMGWREQITFWPTLLGFLLFMMGLWAGRSIAIAGVVLFAATLTGYFVAGDYLHLWMAVTGGGAMIGAGFWLRR